MDTSLKTITEKITSLFPHHGHDISLAVSGDELVITGPHTSARHHIIDDLSVKINGSPLRDAQFETTISGQTEQVTFILPFEPKPGDVIVVDTAEHSFGSKKIRLKLE